MTLGVGGCTAEQALASLDIMTDGAEPIGLAEYQARIARAQALMRQQGIAAAFINAGSNLRYFTGVQWRPSERLVGAVLPVSGALEYLAPAFEEGTVRDFQVAALPAGRAALAKVVPLARKSLRGSCERRR